MILIAFGANLASAIGTPQQTYAALPKLLAQHSIAVINASSLYRTAPVPISDQPDYQNAALLVQTQLAPQQLLQALMRIENELGRKRSVTNAARGIDLDLIAYDDMQIKTLDLQLPHPRMHERRFVLDPVLEIAPQWRHPVSQLSAQQMIAALKEKQAA